MSMTTTSVTPSSITSLSSPFARHAMVDGRRVEYWATDEVGLTQTMRWKRPRMIFVCAHGDLFAEGALDQWIDKVFAVMALSRHHIFHVLTKRPDRMRAYVKSRIETGEWLGWTRPDDGGGIFDVMTATWERCFAHVWLGVSVEDQRRADERIPILLDTPAAVRWISAEPLLGQVDLTSVAYTETALMSHRVDVLRAGYWNKAGWIAFGPAAQIGEPRGGFTNHSGMNRLDWVVVGGESGPGARVWPGFEDAARSIRDQCAAAGVPFFMKQMQGARKASMPPIPTDLMIRQFPETHT